MNIKNSLMIIGGLGATLVGLVMMKKASKKAKQIMDEHANTENIIEECATQTTEEEYSEADRLNDHKINNIQTTLKIIGNYLIPYAIVISGGMTTITGSFKYIMKEEV